MIVVLFMGVLAVAFFRIQVLGSDSWELRARSNRIRQLPPHDPLAKMMDSGFDDQTHRLVP